MIRLESNQACLRGGQRVPEAAMKRALKAVEGELAHGRDLTVSVAFVPEKEMRKLNKEWRGKDAVTDVLSFGDDAGNGEIILNYEQAARQAKDMAHSVRDEVLFLLVHGALHLHGFDHIKPKDAKRMFPIQSRILASLGVDPRI